MEFRLNEPEKTQQGFSIRVSTKNTIPLSWVSGNWKNSEEVIALLLETQQTILNLLFERRNAWFSTPPTKKQLTNLMKGWEIAGVPKPPDSTKNYSSSLVLTGILIGQDGIQPKWVSPAWNETPKITMPWGPEQETDVEGLEEVDDSREISIDTDSAPIPIISKETRDYLDRKFAAKERVKEARLKAQVAKRLALREMRYFFERFSLEDDESTFSDYDLTDEEEDSEQETDEDELIPPSTVSMTSPLRAKNR